MLEIKEKITRQTEKMLIKHGYRGLRIDDLAKELSISKRTIYEHFSSKDDLVLSVFSETISEFHRKIEARIIEIENDNSVFLDKLKEVIQLVIEHIRLMTDEFFEDIRKNINCFENQVGHLIDEKKYLYLRFLNKGLEYGYLRKDVNYDLLVLLVNNSLFMIADTEVQKSLNLTLEDIVHQTYDIFYNGLFTDYAKQNPKSIF